MPHVALYRKRRPRAFNEIVGQPHIVKTLLNQLVSGQVSHAYLFCGTRGTGKTSAAKILARAVNCIQRTEGNPCNVCSMCESILADRCLDVVEIDAASNNGVDNIRDLRDGVKYLPGEGRYKVYIIDEVHMLSAGAFNALLKTLEEPPAHVIFILATTDPQKIPATILSRCQRYDFRRISSADIAAALREYLNEEGLTYEDTALHYIAYHSDGAMRDALSLLDQCLSMSGGVTLDTAREILGAVDGEKLFEFADALGDRDIPRVMSVISGAMDEGRDVSQLASDSVRHFRDVLVAGLAGGDEFSPEVRERLAEQSRRISRERLMEFISAFSEVIREMRFAASKRTAFEVCALKLCAVFEAPEGIAGQACNDGGNIGAQARKVRENTEIQPERPSLPKDSKTGKSLLSEIADAWEQICRRLPNPLRSWCTHANAEPGDGCLKIICDNEAAITLLKGKQTVIREIIADIFNVETPPTLAFEVREAYNKENPFQKIETRDEPLRTRPSSNDWAAFGQTVITDETESPF